jgi:hypothetical protein
MNHKREVTLAGEQVKFCRALIIQDLMKVCQLLGKNVNASGERLSKKERHELVSFSSKVQLLLLALGESSAEIERIVRNFSKG